MLSSEGRFIHLIKAKIRRILTCQCVCVRPDAASFLIRVHECFQGLPGLQHYPEANGGTEYQQLPPTCHQLAFTFCAPADSQDTDRSGKQRPWGRFMSSAPGRGPCFPSGRPTQLPGPSSRASYEGTDPLPHRACCSRGIPRVPDSSPCEDSSRTARPGYGRRVFLLGSGEAEAAAARQRRAGPHAPTATTANGPLSPPQPASARPFSFSPPIGSSELILRQSPTALRYAAPSPSRARCRRRAARGRRAGRVKAVLAPPTRDGLQPRRLGIGPRRGRQTGAPGGPAPAAAGAGAGACPGRRLRGPARCVRGGGPAGAGACGASPCVRWRLLRCLTGAQACAGGVGVPAEGGAGRSGGSGRPARNGFALPGPAHGPFRRAQRVRVGR